MTQEELYKAAQHLWGIDSQLEILQEELFELYHALAKYFRYRKTSSVNISNFADVINELADVDICMSQAKLILNQNKLATEYINARNAKLSRLEKLIADFVKKNTLDINMKNSEVRE